MATVWNEVGDRVYMRRYSTWHDQPFDQNIGVVLGADGALVVDTRASHRMADELIRDIRGLTSSRIAAVVNTHHHWDHAWGNAQFRPAPIWGHARCAEFLVERSRAALESLVQEHPELADELGEVEVTPPTDTFEDDAAIDLGDRQVELRHLGHGHTDNDIVVVVPDAAVLFAGDLLENDAPPSFGDAFPIAWAGTAERMLPLVTGAVVPGHGSVGDVSFAQRQARELAALADLGAQMADGSIDAAELIRRSPFPAETTQWALRRMELELGIGAGGD